MESTKKSNTRIFVADEHAEGSISGIGVMSYFSLCGNQNLHIFRVLALLKIRRKGLGGMSW
jgi:hypothetical protein